MLKIHNRRIFCKLAEEKCVKRNKSKKLSSYIKNQYISTKVLQVLYCNLQDSILKYCQIKIIMFLFFIVSVYILKKYYPGLISVYNIYWLSSLKMNTRPQFLGCFVKCFYFVWSKLISACQKCVGDGASIAVPTWCTVSMAKVSIGIAIRWRVVGNVNVMAPTESRSIRGAAVYGISVITIQPCLRKFHRRQSWLVNQREKKCLGIISNLAAGTCWKNKRWKGWSDAQTSFKNSNTYRQENILILLIIINSLLSSKYIGLLKSVF